MLLLKIGAVIILVFVYLSPLVISYAVYTERNLDRHPILGVKFLSKYTFLTGTVIALTIFFSGGFERLLFFIPNDWGNFDELGDWTSTKQYISIIAGFFLSLWVCDKIDKNKLK